MAYLGPFFYINNKLICNKCTFEQARIQGDKLDNSYGHDRLYDDYFAEGDYIFYPRGRVIGDKIEQRAIIYIDPIINNQRVIEAVVSEFELEEYIVEFDEHYQCDFQAKKRQ